MKKIAIVSLMFSFQLFATPENLEKAVNEIFAPFATRADPGCNIGIAQDGQTRLIKSYGMADLNQNVPLSASSVFRIASASKQFAAMTMALLSESGQLNLDAPISELFPEFAHYPNSLTTRTLIHHTSGLRDYLYIADHAGMPEYYSQQEAMELIANQNTTNFVPGSNYSYSNSGFFLLSQIVLKVTGKSLREYADQHIFDPLGMHHSIFYDDNRIHVANRAKGYRKGNDGTYEISMTQLEMVGDGGLLTTIPDALKWLANFRQNRLGSGSQELIETVETPYTLSDGRVIDYGFGLRLTQYRNLDVRWHSGSFVGFKSVLMRFPAKRTHVAIFCNNREANPTQMGFAVVDALFFGGTSAPEPEASPAPSVPHLLGEYAGGWIRNSSYWQVSLGPGGMILQTNRGETYTLHKLTKTRYQIATNPVTTLEFHEDGQVVRAIQLGRDAYSYKRIQRKPVPQKLKHQLNGNHLLPEINQTVEMTFDDNWLVVRGLGTKSELFWTGTTFVNPGSPWYVAEVAPLDQQSFSWSAAGLVNMIGLRSEP